MALIGFSVGRMEPSTIISTYLTNNVKYSLIISIKCHLMIFFDILIDANIEM